MPPVNEESALGVNFGAPAITGAVLINGNLEVTCVELRTRVFGLVSEAQFRAFAEADNPERWFAENIIPNHVELPHVPSTGPTFEVEVTRAGHQHVIKGVRGEVHVQGNTFVGFNATDEKAPAPQVEGWKDAADAYRATRARFISQACWDVPAVRKPGDRRVGSSPTGMLLNEVEIVCTLVELGEFAGGPLATWLRAVQNRGEAGIKPKLTIVVAW